MSKGSAFVLGVLMGGMFGWVLGVLSAPQSGQETRSAIGEKATELRRKAGQAAGQVRAQARRS